jgi:acyl-CoA thioester hydrolase
MEASGIMMPVYENASRYLQPALYDDLLTVKVLVKNPPSARMVFDYEIYNEGGTLLHTGVTTLVFLNRSTNRPCRAPGELLERLKPYFA